MTNLKFISAVILLATASVVHAQTAAPLPGDQGLSSVNKNLEKHPDNKGLQNAAERHEQNHIKHNAQAERRMEKKEDNIAKKAERIESRAEYRETVGRPAKVERPGK